MAAQTATTGRSTREAILERAVDLASAEGLEGLTIGRLAADLEMSKSGLFGHFGSKEELQLATIEAASKRFVGTVIGPSLEAPEGRERLHALCERYLDHLERRVYPGGCFWSAVASEFDDRPGAVRDTVRERVAAWIGVLGREARAAGIDDPEQLAFELQAVIQAANHNRQLFGDEDAFRRARLAVERLLG